MLKIGYNVNTKEFIEESVIDIWLRKGSKDNFWFEVLLRSPCRSPLSLLTLRHTRNQT